MRPDLVRPAGELGIGADSHELDRATRAVTLILEALERSAAQFGPPESGRAGLGAWAVEPSKAGGQPSTPRSDPREAVERALQEIGSRDPEIGAFRLVDLEGAREQASALLGVELPLLGLPVGVKDLIDVGGQPTTAGSPILEGNLARTDAPVVRALRGAGAVLVGKTNLHEFAFGVTGVNPHHGTVRNPRAIDRIAGGSSSGSAAAVAAGFCPAALGTDTGGSVRIPAALCGVVGFKPSHGALPMAGVLPLSATLDHVGYLAESVATAARVHLALTGVPPAAPRRWRAGLIEDWVEGSEEAVRSRVGEAVRALEPAFELTPLGLSLEEAVYAASSTILLGEAAQVHLTWLRTRLADYGPDVRIRLLQGIQVPPAAMGRALRLRDRLSQVVASRLEGMDVLIGPSVPNTAPLIETARDAGVSRDLVRFTRLGNLLGMPAISVPVPGSGLPVGLQILAPPGADGHVLGAAREAEALLGPPAESRWTGEEGPEYGA